MEALPMNSYSEIALLRGGIETFLTRARSTKYFDVIVIENVWFHWSTRLRENNVSKISVLKVFGDRFHWIRVAGRRFRKEKVAFSNDNGYMCHFKIHFAQFLKITFMSTKTVIGKRFSWKAKLHSALVTIFRFPDLWVLTTWMKSDLECCS